MAPRCGIRSGLRALALGAGLFVLTHLSAAAQPLQADSSASPARWTISWQGKPVLVYEFGPHKYKPYVQALHTTRGDNVLRDAPFDHLHHHALMYGIKVNDVNFWEEASGSGVQRVVKTDAPALGQSSSGRPQAVLRQDLVWVPAVDAFLPLTNCNPLLREQRTLTLTVDAKTSEVALLWHSKFTAGSRSNNIVLTGSSYHGLGMRFLQELDPVATHIAPSGRVDLANNRQDNTVYPWEAVTFNAPGKPATIAVLGPESNARGHARYFSMATPFAYLSATQALDTEPITYKPGDTFELRYLVLLYPEIKSTENLAARYRQFAASGGND